MASKDRASPVQKHTHHTLVTTLRETWLTPALIIVAVEPCCKVALGVQVGSATTLIVCAAVLQNDKNVNQ
jgi:CBS-domain-containing membrane protein